MSVQVPTLVLTAAILWMGSATDASACGDKFLVNTPPGADGTQLASLAPSAIVVLRVASDELDREIFTDELIETLATIGHHVTVVDDLEALRKLPADELDLALFSGSSAEAMRALMQSEGLNWAFLPLLDDPSITELEEARRSFGQAFALPGHPSELFGLIDEAIMLRESPESS